MATDHDRSVETFNGRSRVWQFLKKGMIKHFIFGQNFVESRAKTNRVRAGIWVRVKERIFDLLNGERQGEMSKLRDCARVKGLEVEVLEDRGRDA